VVAGAIKLDAGRHDAPQRVGQIAARRVENGEVIEPRAAGGRRRAIEALPSIQRDMVMIAAGRDEGCTLAPLRHLEPEHTTIKRQGPLEISHLEVDMADAGPADDGP
jgi:hypothetical protein